MKAGVAHTQYLSAAVAAHHAAIDGFFATHSEMLVSLAHDIHHRLTQGAKLLLCGNGGSACDAMHIAGEFVGRFTRERKGLAAIALSADSGILTAVGNDYGFERIFARQVEAYGAAGDVLIALTTSGSSPNILAALEQARLGGLHRILLTGEKGKDKTAHADVLMAVPSTDTARIQEAHMLALHLLADMVESLSVEGS